MAADSSAGWQAAYMRDLANQTTSGPHRLNDEHRALNRQVADALDAKQNQQQQQQLYMPIPDIHKTSDCDLIYRFLIAAKWNVATTTNNIIDYVAFRKEKGLDTILWEQFPDEMKTLKTAYRGFDREGHPVYVDRIVPSIVSSLCAHFPQELLIRVHFAAMEAGRRLQKMYNVDRVTCILDFAELTMSVVTNRAAASYMNELVTVDQKYYPENMRYMLICNSGWVFSSGYNLIKGLLDQRIQLKIQFMSGSSTSSESSKNAMIADVQRFIPPESLTREFGGPLTESDHIFEFEQLQTTGVPVGSPPEVMSSSSVARSRNPRSPSL